MTSKKQLVEVAVDTEDGRIPLGIMNADQALALPDDLDVEVSHPDHEPGNTDLFIQKDELRRHLDDQYGRPGCAVREQRRNLISRRG